MVAVLRIDDQLSFVQELVGHEDRLVEVTARIAAQVEDQFRNTLRTQRIERPADLRRGRARKLTQTDVADAVHDPEGRLDAPDRDHAALDFHIDQSGNALPLETEADLRAARPAQAFHDLVLRHPAPGDQRIVDLHDPVARLDTGPVARPLRNDVEHDDRIGGHVEDHADAVELPFEGFVQFLHLRSRDVDRMGVEFSHEHRDDMLGQGIHRHGIDIAVFDE